MEDRVQSSGFRVQGSNREPRTENREPPRSRERGIALIITLGILTVIMLLAVAFALASRTEVKSAATYDALVSCKALAKMGMDRCLMELTYNNENTPFSGGNTNIYTSADFTKAVGGNYPNDINPVFAGAPADFVNLDSDPTRGPAEPYWIKVTDRSGKMIGRFAYTIVTDTIAHSNAWRSLVDLNAVGNIQGQQQTYARNGGYIGVANAGYTRGICGDVNLIAFLDKLGYADPTNAAFNILNYRYGWPAGKSTNKCNGCYNPGKSGNDNLDGTLPLTYSQDEATEYDPVNLRGSGQDFDHAISDLSQLQSLFIAPDAAFSNLVNYATISSGDPNRTNLYGEARLNLNATRTGNAIDVSNVVALLTRTFPSYGTNQLTQWAVNLVDFHTADTWPTVYTGGVGGTNLFIGIKATPYLNQICPKITLSVNTSGTNAQIQITANTYVELWNPFPNFSQKMTVTVTNAVTFGFNPPIPNLTPTAGVCSVLWTQVKPDYQVGNQSVTWYSSWFPTNNLGNVVVSNTMSWAYYNTGVPSNLISVGSVVGPATNVTFTTTTSASYTPNVEADDPRLPVLYPQPNGANVGGSGNYGLGFSNQFTWAAQGGPNSSNREGLASLYVKQADYISIGEIGYVHRGEPWKTISLQPGGEGRLLDYLRVNDLTEIRGRVNLNCETDGPGGAPLQSPSFWALFSGLSNPAYGVVTSNKIENIIAGLSAYRDSVGGLFTNISQICEVSNLVYNTTWNDIPYTNDAARESIVRDISNLITTRPDSVTEVRAWGQVIKGNVPVGSIAIQAWYQKDPTSKRIKITKFQYIKQ